MATSPRSIDAILVKAVEIESPDERAAYLDGACGDDAELRRRVEVLIADHFQAGDFLEQSPLAPTIDVRPSVEKPGVVIGPYKLLQVIGEGGMGVVYMAEQSEPVSRRVALKIIKPGMDTGQVIARFEAERQALAMMDHPNIAKVLDAGATEAGRPYFVMELVKGIPISDYCDEQHFTPKERLELFVKVCHAVQHAHQKGVIHRDLKPSNVLIAEYDQQAVPKIIDFGVAKATSQKLTEKTMFTQYGQIVGTLEYMSPEQAKLNQLDIDTRSDVYSLGVLLYQLLTGTTPLEKERLQSAAFEEMLRIIREEEPPKPSTRISTVGKSAAMLSGHRRTTPHKLHQFVRGELDWVVMRALEKDRSRRYESASSFASDIERFLHDEAVQACPPSAIYRFRKFVRRYKAATATAAIVAGAIIAGLFGTSWQAIRATLAETDAREKRIEAELESFRATLAEQDAGKQRDRAIEAENRARAEAKRAETKSIELAEQLRVANATRLAAQSQALRSRSPVRSLLLATESVRETWNHDRTVTPIAHEALLNTLPTVAGRPLRGHSNGIDRVVISPDGHWLVTSPWRTVDGVSEPRLWNLHADDPTASSSLLRGHHGDINELVISADNRWLVTIGRDTTARLWDLNASDPTASPIVLSGHQKEVTAVAVSPDCRWLVTGSWRERAVRVWDLTSSDPGNSSIELPDSEFSTPFGLDINISSDSRWLVTPTLDRTIHLWRLGSVGRELSPTTFSNPIHRMQISPNGRWLATVTNESKTLTRKRTLQLWDMSGEHLSSTPIELTGHGNLLGPLLEFSSTSRWLVAANDDHTARVWDLTSVDSRSSPLVLEGHEAPITSLAMSEDGRWLATGSSDETLRLSDLTAADSQSSSRVLRGHRGSVIEVIFGPNGRWLTSVSSEDGSARLWDLTADQISASSQVLRGHDGSREARSIAVDPSGRWLVTHGLGDTVPRLWDLAAIEPSKSSLELNSPDHISSITISSNGQWLATAGPELARVWDISGENPPVASIVDLPYSSQAPVTVSQDNRWLATVEDEVVHLWDLATPEPRFASSTRLPHMHPVNSVAFSSDGRWLAAGSGPMGADVPIGDVQLWDLRVQPPVSVALPSHDGPGSRFAFSSNGHWLVTGWKDGWTQTPGVVRLWDLEATDWIATPRILTSGTGFRAISISPDDRWLVVGGTDGVIRVWKLSADGLPESPTELKNIERRTTMEHTWVTVWSPDSRWLVTAGDHGIVRVWDFESKAPEHPTHVMRGHETGNRWGFVRTGAISPDGRLLVTGSLNGEARLWDLSADDPAASSVVLRHEGNTNVAITPNGRWVVTAAGRQVRFWDVSIETLMQRARSLAGRDLTAEERARYYLDTP